jgi:hypothetical protein
MYESSTSTWYSGPNLGLQTGYSDNFRGFPQFLKSMPRLCLRLGHCRLLQYLSNSSMSLSFDAVCSDLLTASLNKAQIYKKNKMRGLLGSNSVAYLRNITSVACDLDLV